MPHISSAFFSSEKKAESLFEACLNHFFLSSAYFDYKEDGVLPKPPSYNVATTLPSYDEAERTKAEATVPLVTGRVSVSLVPSYLD